MSDAPAPAWKPLNSRQRRVLGVLVEKAKTTPDTYPMTINSIVAGCNQKSNREPLMSLSPEDVEQLVQELRAMSAVTEIQGVGRTLKYRHHFYDWLGIDKAESACDDGAPPSRRKRSATCAPEPLAWSRFPIRTPSSRLWICSCRRSS